MPAHPLAIEFISPDRLTEHPDNPRDHSRKQRRQIARSIRRLGFYNPILVNELYVIIAGHGRYQAAIELGLESVPVIRLDGLSEAEQCGLMVADNRIAEGSSWDPDRLTKVLRGLTDISFDLEDVGFDTAEVDLLLNHHDDGSIFDEADAVEEPNRNRPAISKHGDLYVMGPHRLLCGNALDPESYVALLGSELARAVVADSPYNVRTEGHISSRNRARHPSFMQAAGELSEEQFTGFLRAVMTLLCMHSVDGSLHYLFMDWRHMFELLTASRDLYELKNMCIWAKDNGGLGSLYRSQHEIVAVFKNGNAPHINNIELGRHGRNRTNVWRYPGVNTMRKGRLADLKDHPTIKPVALIADAILDCTKIGDTVLDPFVGSGTTILSAERTRRRAAAIEIDPFYVDTAIRRVQERTGLMAVHHATGATFDELASLKGGSDER
ncbi:site-specific DNA-methyltransferase [uncultured Enterovirga sp.]|uniref:site-specific DNA-methyltransferase n=1 Tax=uncultured Enterovirga sp. TaxID=2026352 RepID=UPI0035CA4F7F